MRRERKDIVALYNIAMAVGSSLSLQKIIRRLYQEVSQSIDTSNFAVVIYDEPTDGLNFYLVFDQGQKVKPFAIKHSTNKGLISQIIKSQDPCLIEDLTKTEHLFEIDQLHPDKPVRSWLGIPFLNTISPDGTVRGAIATWSYKPNVFSQRDLWFLAEVGAQTAIAVRNAYLFEASQRRVLEMAVVDDVAQTLSSTLELDDVLHRMMAQVEGMLNVQAGFLLLKDPATEDLVYQFALGEQIKNVKPFRIPKGYGIAGRVAETGKPMIVEKGKRGVEVIDFRAQNALCVPLVLREQVIGVLEVLNKKVGSFSQRDLELLSSVASFAAIAIENARLHESVLAERDRVIEAEEEARKALARDLHDGPIQLVAGVVMRLNFCQQVLERDPSLLTKELPQTMALAEQAIQEMRTTLFELRPLVLETEGLQTALSIFLDRQQQEIKANGKSVELTLKIDTGNSHNQISRLENKVEAAIFAIIQEAVTNAIKHAEANSIKIQLQETLSAVYVTILDDGVGFDVEQVMDGYERRTSLGMVNIQERSDLIGGDLAVRSTPGRGTRIRVAVPKETDERMKKRGQTGMLNNAQRVPTGLLARLGEGYANHKKSEYNSDSIKEGP